MSDSFPTAAPLPTMQGRIVQISISDGGVPKRSVPQGQITHAGLVGDRQADLKHHGGSERAICLWSAEIIQLLQDEGHPLAPGHAGENITVAGLNWQQLRPGVQLKLGNHVILQVTDYAQPCRTIAHYFKLNQYDRISQKHHPGLSRLYARVLTTGSVSVGDTLIGLNVD